MGLFLSMSGVIGCSSEQVQNALKGYAEGQSGQMEIVNETNIDMDTGAISSSPGNTTIVYPGDFVEWDEASEFLSRQLNTAVFSFHIHDGDFWMYTLFQLGEKIDHFLPVPEYWGELPDGEKRACRGNADLISRTLKGVAAESIRDYLVEWDVTAEECLKAYPDDEFPVMDCWQICDFMKRIGLSYPIDDNGKVAGTTFRFVSEAGSCGQSMPNTKSQRPWWKFW